MKCPSTNDSRRRLEFGIVPWSTTWWAIGCIAVSVTSLSPGASAPSPKEVVESCRQAITCWNKPLSTKIGTQVEITSTDAQDGNIGYRESDWLFHWDGRRADQSGSTRFLASRTAEKADYTARSVNLADGQRFYSAEQAEGWEFRGHLTYFGPELSMVSPDCPALSFRARIALPIRWPPQAVRAACRSGGPVFAQFTPLAFSATLT